MADNSTIPTPTTALNSEPTSTVNRHVTIETDGLEVVTRCGMLARELRLRGYPDARFQVQVNTPADMPYRMFTVVIPDGSTVNGEPGGRAFMFGEAALATSENRRETATTLTQVMGQLEMERRKGTASSVPIK